MVKLFRSTPTVKRPLRALRPGLEACESRTAAAMLVIPAPTPVLAVESLSPGTSGLYPLQGPLPSAPAPIAPKPAPAPVKPTSSLPAPTPAPKPTVVQPGSVVGGAIAGAGLVPILFKPVTR